MASQLYYSPFIPAFSSNGAPIPGAELNFYMSGTSTRVPVYADAALTTPLANPVRADAAGKFPNIYLDKDVVYRVIQTGPGGLQIGDQIDPYYPGQAVTTVAGLPELIAPDGASKVGFQHNAPGSLPRSVQDKGSDTLSVLDFIPESLHAAISNGTSTADVSAYIQTAIDYLNQVGVSGSLYFPHGIYRVTALTVTYVTNAPIRLHGDGILSSVIRKIGPSTAPVLTFTSSQQLLDVYPEISNMSFDGLNVATAAIKITDCARIYMHRVGADKAVVGIDGAGFLSSKLVNCRTDDCEIGIRTRKAAIVYSNLLVISQHEARSNSKWGMDIGGGEAIRITDSEIQNCGTPGDLTTGGMAIRSTVGTEAGLGSITLENNYWEVCRGNGLLVEDATGLSLTQIGSGFYATEGGRAATIGNIRSSTIIDAKAGSASDVIAIAAQNSCVTGGIVFALQDTSVHRVQINATTSVAHYALSANELFGFGSTGNEMYLASRDMVAGGGLPSTTSIFKYGGRAQFEFPGGSIPLAVESGKIGFFQTTPVVKQALPAAATDAASTQALANALRSLAVAYGLA